ncbi:MAG: esterase-like activity of phytase family protein, partial [Bosea sp. (in: a-proteobacteria)]
MRLTRRQSLVMLAGYAGLPLMPAMAQATGAAPVEIKAIPLAAFEPRNPDKRKFGQLTFRSGLQLSADQKRFGGFSGLWRSGDGRQLVTVTDNGWWLTANVETKAGRLKGLSQAIMAPVLGQTRPL